MTDTAQVLQTPGHPSAYPANLRCRWYLTAASSASVLIHFTALQIAGGERCARDKLTVQQVGDGAGRGGGAPRDSARRQRHRETVLWLGQWRFEQMQPSSLPRKSIFSVGI